MGCFRPIGAFRTGKRTASGKTGISLRGSASWRPGLSDFNAFRVWLPCGTCDGCKLERSRQWAVRCLHEASLHERNCFITLTYSDEFLPPYGGLVKKDFQDFMKRLRKEFKDETIRFFHCGEYGSRYGRPHYHACIFGLDFADKVFLGKSKGFSLWRSSVLERLWPFGRSTIGAVTFESAAYVARYVLDKDLYGKQYDRVDYETGETVEVAKEYITMSRRPGIAKAWFDKHKDDIIRRGDVVVRGKSMQPPRYYDVQMEIVLPGEMERLRQERRRGAKRKTQYSLDAKAALAKSRLTFSERSPE